MPETKLVKKKKITTTQKQIKIHKGKNKRIVSLSLQQI